MAVGQCGVVVGISATGPLLRRFLDIGIIIGTKIECIMKSGMGDPAAYLIRGAVIAIRNVDAAKITVRA